MEKSKLLNFIAKYSLGGSVETVEWKIDPNKISTRFMTDQQDVIGEISVDVTNSNDESISIGISNTSLLVKMLSVLEDEIELLFTTLNGNNSPNSIVLNDNTTTVNYMAADSSIIQKVPNPKKMPDFNYEFEFNRENFSDKFVKAKAAFSDIDIFTIIPSKNGVSVKLGSNENKLTLKLPSISGTASREISFDAKLLKEILVANKDASGGKFSVIEDGIGKVELFTEGYSITYYLIEKIQPS
jgi:hypothetical protein